MRFSPNNPQPPWDRRFCVLLLGFVIPLGIGSKLYQGPGSVWVVNYGGDLLYEWAWLGFILLLNPRLSLTKTCVSIFSITSLVELSQLWHPAWLEHWRSTIPGRFLLGSTFSPEDFLYYGLGCGLGWLLFWAYHRGRSFPTG